ncbi:MAG: S24 family peptidase [Pseudomonadota bacterium]|nr:S24 family peptidase [Pseudomonadota bacterium]
MSNCAGNEPFALQVLGNSMAPEFPDGCVVVSEPVGRLHNGSFVIAEHGGEVILRQLDRDNDRWYLKALNASYPVLEITGPEDIKGVVIQRAGHKRADRKSYL